MDNKEYLKNRFKRDFLQYSLLQEDSLPANEIAEKLYRVIDLERYIHEAKHEIESLCSKYLSFQKVRVDGKFSNVLSDELGFDLKDKILEEYKSYLNNHSTEEIAKAVISKVERSVELQTWSNGIVNMQDAIDKLRDRLNSLSRSYEELYTAPVADNQLLEKFNKAKENTLLERIQGNNIDDIIEYRSALIQYVEVSCQNMLYDKLHAIYNSVAHSNSFEQLKSNFGKLLNYACELKASIVDCAPNADWDKEYNRLVPTDFYYRNVENFTPEQAFHMVLLQFFAQNEDWMIQNGMLADGNLKVYVGNSIVIDKLMDCLSKKL